jgi:hypothetical protein
MVLWNAIIEAELVEQPGPPSPIASADGITFGVTRNAFIDSIDPMRRFAGCTFCIWAIATALAIPALRRGGADNSGTPGTTAGGRSVEGSRDPAREWGRAAFVDPPLDYSARRAS